MNKIIETLMKIYKLKELRREGWFIDGVKNGESIASHIFGTAFLILVLGKGRKDIDLEKALEIALVHDIAESETGDIIEDYKVEYHKKKFSKDIKGGYHGISHKEKFELEKRIIEEFANKIGKKEIVDLWEEFESGKTKEAVFVRSLDKLDMALQALIYEKKKAAKNDISHYFENATNTIKDPDIMRILKEILSLRKGR